MRCDGPLTSALGAAAVVACALAVAGCGGDGHDGAVDWSSGGPTNTPGPESAPEGADAKFPLDTVVTVTIYESDGSGRTFERTMTFAELQELCEGQREEMIQEAEAAGSEIVAGPIVTFPYTAAEGDRFDQASHEYTCGN